MTIAQEKWESLIAEFEGMLVKAKKAKDPVQSLVKSDMRTLCFKLQGLARVYEHLHNKKRFAKIKEEMKEIEDLFGQLDFYSTALKLWKTKKGLPKEFLNHISAEIEKVKIKIFDLITEKYFNSDKRMRRTKKKIGSADWLDETQELVKIKEFLQEELAEIKELLADLPFTEMELQVHELRRKLRWISIYAQNLSGKIAYSKKVNSKYSSMINKDARASAFNKLPNNKLVKNPILFDKNAFLAISTIIAELGIIKDKGLYAEYAHSLFMDILHTDEKSASQKNSTILKYPSNIHDEMLTQANELAKTIVESGLLDELIDAH